MLNVLKKWVNNYFVDEEAISLLLMLLAALLIMVFAGSIIAPIIASIIIAYLLQGIVQKLLRWMSYSLAVMITFILFFGLFLVSLFLGVPVLGKQITHLVAELPNIVRELQAFLLELQAAYPQILSERQIQDMAAALTREVGSAGQMLLSFSLASIPSIFAMMVYMVLIPILVFFFLKDKDLILSWLAQFLPSERPLMTTVWREMNVQVANYARGKAVEILIVGVVSYITFALFGLKYAVLLSLLVGLSVIIPYIGAAAVTIPIAIIGYFQFGMSDTFVYLLIAYGVIQFLDGNVLVPLLFSEAVNLHPVAIITAVLVFGGLWGLWGVFFAIPLATLVKSLLQAWPSGVRQIEQTDADIANSVEKEGVE